MNLKELNEKIIEWAKDREIDKKGTIEGQAIKTIEEMSELIKGICKNDIDLIKDSIGDVYVTLVIGCMLSGKKVEDIINIEDKRQDYVVIGKVENLYPLTCYLKNILNELDTAYADNVYSDLLVYCLVDELDSMADSYGSTLVECVQLAYKEISNRKGKMIDGVFVKEEDLKGAKH